MKSKISEKVNRVREKKKLWMIHLDTLKRVRERKGGREEKGRIAV